VVPALEKNYAVFLADEPAMWILSKWPTARTEFITGTCPLRMGYERHGTGLSSEGVRSMRSAWL